MKIKAFLTAIAIAVFPFASSAEPTVDTVLNTGVLEPHSITAAGDSKFYISDSASHRVLSFDSDNGSLTSIAGVNGQAGSTDGPGFLARFLSPRGLVRARGGLIVADSGNHTLRFLTVTGAVSVVTT